MAASSPPSKPPPKRLLIPNNPAAVAPICNPVAIRLPLLPRRDLAIVPARLNPILRSSNKVAAPNLMPPLMMTLDSFLIALPNLVPNNM